MSRQICVYQEFLSDAHRARIDRAAAAAGFTVHYFTLNQFEEAKACLQDCEVLFAHSPELVRSAPASLRWYSCSYAGADPYCKDDGIFQNPDCLMTNASGAYGVTIAEHIIMVLLMLLRRMPEFEAVMRERSWTGEKPMRSIYGSDITVLGPGNIGSTFARRARAMGAGRLTGVSRSGKRRDDVFDEMVPFDRLDEVLPAAHILVMALPGTPETARVLNRERIALLPADAMVVNVGRGTAIDQDALAEALNRGRIAGAALDVMDPEPLPADHPLRDAKNLILTPHISGNMSLGYTADRAVELFCENIANYAAGRPLNQLVDRRVGY